MGTEDTGEQNCHIVVLADFLNSVVRSPRIKI